MPDVDALQRLARGLERETESKTYVLHVQITTGQLDYRWRPTNEPAPTHLTWTPSWGSKDYEVAFDSSTARTFLRVKR